MLQCLKFRQPQLCYNVHLLMEGLEQILLIISDNVVAELGKKVFNSIVYSCNAINQLDYINVCDLY